MAIIKDIELWHEYAKSVKKLDIDERVTAPQVPMLLTIKKGGKQIDREYVTSIGAIPDGSGRHPPVRVVQLSRQERRSFAGEATIDLHGFSRNISTILMDFCLSCIEKKIKNIVIISGKGEGILKNAVSEWIIANAAIVIGFFEIKDAAGESGAFGVKLRGKISNWIRQ